ncbi:MAG: paraquat-inducible protein A [Campylobacterota bacterium]|nr:paraquat-inducible protein A [Campylobacterota bacterium]
MKTDSNTSLHLCLQCGNTQHQSEKKCLNCDAPINFRVENSLLLTTIFTISAMVFLVPANMLPIMDMISLGKHDPNTIMSGVVYFMHSGEYFVGVVIFIASIVVPFYKILVLIFLIWVAKYKKYNHSMLAMKLFESIEFVGKWSMLDIFVVAMMVGVIQLGNIATVEAGMASMAFMIAVLLTMGAAKMFDSRLLWDQHI